VIISMLWVIRVDGVVRWVVIRLLVVMMAVRNSLEVRWGYCYWGYC